MCVYVCKQNGTLEQPPYYTETTLFQLTTDRILELGRVDLSLKNRDILHMSVYIKN